MHIGIYNNQAFGDALVGTHLARLFKEKNPEDEITFLIPFSMNLTTCKDQLKGLEDIYNILRIQEGVDHIGLVKFNEEGKMNIEIISDEPVSSLDTMYFQKEWWSDLGIVGSNTIFYNIMNDLPLTREAVNTETKFTVGIERELPEELTIVSQGAFEWERKTHTKIFDEFKERISEYATLIDLDVETHDGTYLDALKIAQNCHLFIGVAGSLCHACAGLGVDTITIPSIFTMESESPEFYHSGYHKAIRYKEGNHCGTHECLENKLFKIEDVTNSASVGNPKVQDFWSPTCPINYTKDGFGCVTQHSVDTIMDEFMKWKEQWETI